MAPKTIVYSPVVGDLFHFGHLKSLLFAQNLGDFHVCGVLSDKAVASFRKPTVASYLERRSIFEHLSCVHHVMSQDSFNPIDNVKQLRKEYPHSNIVVVRGSNWMNSPEDKEIAALGVKVVHHPYYDKLSDHVILHHMYKHNTEYFSDLVEYGGLFSPLRLLSSKTNSDHSMVLSTKAETLQNLSSKLSKARIEDCYVFTQKDWEENSSEIVSQINQTFSPSPIVVRSSALAEDSATDSMAGSFESQLNVDSTKRDHIHLATSFVIDSYKNKNSSHPQNQILVQKHTSDVAISGVIFTRQIQNNAPYYVINYDDVSGKTDTVTSGSQSSKVLYVSHFLKDLSLLGPLAPLLEAVSEIESLVSSMALDIEFAITHNGEVVIFQVRPLAANKDSHGVLDLDLKDRVSHLQTLYSSLSKPRDNLSGSYTIFAEMPDWNPAEIIGSEPHHLAYSLYDYVITGEVWHKARSSQGYFDVQHAQLVHLFGIKPYIDVRSSFNSFVPASLSPSVREALVEYYLNKLASHPELQDKVEFDILYTCFDFSFDQRSCELLDNGFSSEDVAILRKSLVSLTDDLVCGTHFSLEDDLALSAKLEASLESHRAKAFETVSLCVSEKLELVFSLLDDLKKYGTLPFSRLARLAFVGNTLLKSLVTIGVISEQEYDSFLLSIETVATSMNDDFTLWMNAKMSSEDFLSRYGHLRPGTYDVCSLRYDQDPAILKRAESAIQGSSFSFEEKDSYEFQFSEEVYSRVDSLLAQEGFSFSSHDLFSFIAQAIEARELSKFEFTKNLSFALELLILFAQDVGLSKESLSDLDLKSLRVACNLDSRKQMKAFLEEVASERVSERKMWKHLVIPPVICSEKDFEIVSLYEVRPNFIGNSVVEGEVVNITGKQDSSSLDLTGKIVLLESGDPGYDWIFTRKPLALITKYGGVASHMSIRCAEFGLAAAIGCGSLFDNLATKHFIKLDCDHKKIE